MTEIKKPQPSETVMVAMRDGTRLATDVYIPQSLENQPLPVVLVRSPYCKEPEAVTFNVEAMLNDGFAVVIQDSRGRFSSEGSYEPLVVEGETESQGTLINDGTDTATWVIEQPWCNGKIGMFGASGYGAPIWEAAANGAPITTGIPMITGSLFGGYGFISRGVPKLDMLLLWNGGMGAAPTEDNELSRFLSSAEGQQEVLLSLFVTTDLHTEEARQLWDKSVKVVQNYRDHADALLNQPLSDATRQVAALSPWVARWLENADPDSDYWENADWYRHHDRMDTPMLQVIGWNDMFINSAMTSLAELTAREGAPFQKIVINPSSHYTCNVCSADFPVGEKTFPRDEFHVEPWFTVETAPQYQGQLFNRWMSYWLKGDDNGIVNDAPISLYVMGENVWRDEWEWPLARTEWTPIYLHSDGNANSASGDGVLSFQLAGEQGADSDRYQYDPSNPVPSQGGIFLGMAQQAGPLDQSPVEQRDDVLVYTSEKLDTSLEITGPVVMKLWASTSAVDTDFTAKLVDVDLDGKAFNICEGVTRLRYRKEKPGLVTPGELQEIEIELSPISYLFKPGHQIRLHVSSSNFPMVDPNPNTGKSLLLDESNEMVVAEQTVYHDVERPSQLILPVIPREKE